MQKKRVVYKRTKVMDFFAGEDRLLAVCITVAAVGGLAAAAARAEGK